MHYAPSENQHPREYSTICYIFEKSKEKIQMPRGPRISGQIVDAIRDPHTKSLFEARVSRTIINICARGKEEVQK